MNGYELSRYWFDWAFENPDLVTSNDTALYMWLIEKNNRCGWSDKFSVSSTESMSACGFKTYPPYKKSFDRLVEYGFVLIVTKSINQFKSNVIALPKNDKAIKKALDKASLKQTIKHVESNQESTFDNNKQDKQETKETLKLDKLFNPFDYLISYGATDDMIKGWFDVRKKKKGVNSEIAMQGFIREVEKSKQDINAVLKKCIEKSWVGFEAEWVKGQNLTTTTVKERTPEQQANFDAWEIL